MPRTVEKMHRGKKKKEKSPVLNLTIFYDITALFLTKYAYIQKTILDIYTWDMTITRYAKVL